MRGSFWLLFLALTHAHLPAQETTGGYLQEDYSCIMCHTDMRSDFLEGVHSSRGIQCVECHGGDPTQFEADASHSGDFRGSITKGEGVDLCLSCHADIGGMRQYALEPVTREEFLFSRHGQRLLVDGDTVAPSCSDCHGAHTILPEEDPRSLVNPIRVSETCARCHTDPQRYDDRFGTGQFAEWATSAHGVGLLERHNERSATCASCHGSHSALAPGVREIPNVCGKCHQLVREAYFRGAHGEQVVASVREGGCVGCHENHGTEMPPFSEIAHLCESCHGLDSPQATAGLELQELILRAEVAGEQGREGVAALIRAGERSTDEEILLQNVETHLRELLVVAHTLDPEAVEDLSRRITSLSREITERAESVGEHRWERRLLVVPVWLLVLAGVLLALRKERRLMEAEPAAEPDPPDGGKT
jgi:hypothetical protein